MTEDIRSLLIDLADTATGVDPDPFGRFTRRVLVARRRRLLWRSGWSGFAAAAVVAVVAGVSLLVGGVGEPAARPADGVFLGWPVAGNAVNSQDVTSATHVWEAASGASPAPHTAIHPILVHDDASLGPIVVLEAFDASGAPRIAWFTGSVADPQHLRLRADRPAPAANVPQVSLVSARMGDVPGDVVGGVAWGLAVGEPGTDHLVMSSTTVDHVLGDGLPGTPPSRVLVTLMPDDTTALSSTIVGYRSAGVAYSRPVDGGAIGDARAVPVSVVRRSSTSVTVTRPSVPVPVGALVATADGLVGRVSAVGSDDVTVELATAPGFHVEARSALTDFPGILAGDGAGMVFTAANSGDQINGGNRIVVTDPAEHSSIAGLLTVGRVSGAAGAVYTVRPSAHDTSVVDIIVASTAR